MSARGRQKPAYDAPEGPPRILEGHIADRPMHQSPGAPLAWRNTAEHPLEKAKALGKIGEDEYLAGNVYRSFFEMMSRTGKDSTQFSVVGSSQGLPFAESQVTAIETIDRIERRMNHARSVMIVRKFCGEGWSMGDSVEAAGYHVREAKERLRVALNKLATAIERAHVNLKMADRR